MNDLTPIESEQNISENASLSAEYLEANRAISLLTKVAFEIRDFTVLESMIKRYEQYILDNGSDFDQIALRSLKHMCEQGLEYEKEKGPWSLLNWTHKLSPFVDKHLKTIGNPTRRDRLRHFQNNRI